MSQSLWQNLADHLKAQQAQVIQEITNYPPPIPACDAQFNYLLEKRYALADELNRLMNLSEHDVSALIEFAADSLLVSKEFKEVLAAYPLTDEYGCGAGRNSKQPIHKL